MMEYYDVGGVAIDCYKVTLPIKKGLSSSAAICVLVARAFNLLYNLQISVRGEMEAAYRGEILTPSRCGRLDQACAYGEKPVLMKFDGDNLEVEQISVGKDLFWVLCDIHGKKDTLKILASLNACYPFAQDEISENVQRALGKENSRIIKETVLAMKQGNAERIGQLMTEAQDTFDRLVSPACPSELLSPKLHKIMDDPAVKNFSLGRKGVGSQGDGMLQMICKDRESQEKLVAYLNCKLGLEAYPFCIRARHSVRKAVIPLAGFGTRLFPASKVVNKAFFPIVDYDGVAKPVLLAIIEELIQSGIEEIAIIIQPDQQEEFDRLFSNITDAHYYQKLSEEKREYNAAIQQIGMKITYIYQEEQLGLGHAVYQAHDFAGGEAVLLLLGDHLYHSNSGSSCTDQVICSFEQCGQLTVSLDEIDINRVSSYGCLTGQFVDSEQRIMRVEAIVEKPSPEFAEQNLAVKDEKGRKHYYSVFGQYVLTPAVFSALRKKVLAYREGSGEIELTDAMEEVRSAEGMYGYVVDGTRYDVGIPEGYKKAVTNYGSRVDKSTGASYGKE